MNALVHLRISLPCNCDTRNLLTSSSESILHHKHSSFGGGPTLSPLLSSVTSQFSYHVQVCQLHSLKVATGEKEPRPGA